MSVPSAPRPSRRVFLKLGAAAAAAALALRLTDWPHSAPDFSSLRIGSTLPMPLPHEMLPDAEALPSRVLSHYDLLLVPAHVAALLIQRGLLQPLHGPTGRAHDPEGRYTVPYAYRVAALRFPNQSVRPKAASWDDLWTAAGQAAWPASGRLIAGAALLRRGYSPNDTHPGHLAQVAADLARLSLRIVPDESVRPGKGEPVQGPLSFVLADSSELGQANGLRLPAEGTMVIEYDWVITAGAARAAAARQFIDELRTSAQPPRMDLPVRLIPLMPLPGSARAQHNEIWASITGYQAALAA